MQATKPKDSGAAAKGGKPPVIDPRKSVSERKSQREKQLKMKAEKKSKEDAKRREEEKLKALLRNRADYKDPYLLAEGEIMIVIEHSDDPGRVLMSTSHDYDKYKRIASKIRQWIMRDFPSMKVIIKPNNHQKDNKRIGCFEIVYFHMKDGGLVRHDIFSKMTTRKWPKWKEVQLSIKTYVKDCNLKVTVVDGSKEKKNQFAGMVIHVKNVLFAKNSSAAGATTKSLAGSQLVQSQTMGQSQVGGSQTGAADASSLTPFKEMVLSDSGVLTFEKLPVGNYAIVFNGNRTYKPVNIQFQVGADRPLIEKTVMLELVEEGFFYLAVDYPTLKQKVNELAEEVNTYHLPTDTGKKQAIQKELDERSSNMKAIKRYKVSLLPSDDSRGEDNPCVPIMCYPPQKTGKAETEEKPQSYEAVIEPGNYDVVLTIGSQQVVLKKKLPLTRGENRFAVIADNNNEFVDEQTYKKKYLTEKKDEEKKEGVSGTAGTAGVKPAESGETRPFTGSSVGGDFEESHHRLGSAEPRVRPGSASLHRQQQDPSYVHLSNQVSKPIVEDPAENEEDKFTIQMLSEHGDLPYEINIFYEDDEQNLAILSKETTGEPHVKFESDRNREVMTLEDAKHREGFYRMIITKIPDIKAVGPVIVMVSCGGTTYSRKIPKDLFSAENTQFLDFGVFKCKPRPNSSP